MKTIFLKLGTYGLSFKSWIRNKFVKWIFYLLISFLITYILTNKIIYKTVGRKICLIPHTWTMGLKPAGNAGNLLVKEVPAKFFKFRKYWNCRKIHEKILQFLKEIGVIIECTYLNNRYWRTKIFGKLKNGSTIKLNASGPQSNWSRICVVFVQSEVVKPGK